MRILICVNRDLASNIALNLLLPALAPHEVRVGLSERVGVLGAVDEPAARSELRAVEQTIPNEILFPLVEKAALPDNGTRYLAFGELERLRGIPVMSLPNPSIEPGLGMVRAFAPDLLVTIRYGAILKPAVIRVPRFGVLNLHSGKLPHYRGVLAVFRALMQGDSELVATLHYISDGTIDTGDTVDVARVPVRKELSLLAHILSLYSPGVALLTQAIETLARGESLQRIPQTASGGAYFTYPTAEDWERFRRDGWRVTKPEDLLYAYKLYI